MSAFDVTVERAKGRGGLGWGLPLLAVSVLATAVVATLLLAPPRLDPTTDCPVEGLPPASALLVIDVTDPLLAAQPGVVDAVVDRALHGLPRGGRIAVVPIDGVERVEAPVLFNRCRPGRNNNRDRNRFRDQVAQPLKAEIASLAARGPAPRSPILTTVLAVAADPRLAAAGKADVYLVTDGLEHSAYANSYRKAPFPIPMGEPLAKTQVHLTLLRNERDRARQPEAVRQLTAWLTAAGAEVDYAPPTWMALEKQGDR